MPHTLIGVAVQHLSGRYIGSDDNAGEAREGLCDSLAFDSFEDDLLEMLDKSRAIKQEVSSSIIPEVGGNFDTVDLTDDRDERLADLMRSELQREAALNYGASKSRAEDAPVLLEDGRAIARPVPETSGSRRAVYAECLSYYDRFTKFRKNVAKARSKKHKPVYIHDRSVPHLEKRHAYGRKPWQHDEHLARVETALEIWWDELEHATADLPLPNGVSDTEATFEEELHQELCREALVTAEYLSNLDRRTQEANYLIIWWHEFYRDRGIKLYADNEKQRLDNWEEWQREETLMWYIVRRDAKAKALATKLNHGNTPSTMHLIHAHMIMDMPREFSGMTRPRPLSFEARAAERANRERQEAEQKLLEAQKRDEDNLKRHKKPITRISRISPSVPQAALADLLDEAI